MTTQEFEQKAKEAVVEIMAKKHGVQVKAEDLQFVWFAHELGYKKCTFYAKDLGHYYPEVTYNLAKSEMYIDIYYKQSNTRILLTPEDPPRYEDVDPNTADGPVADQNK